MNIFFTKVDEKLKKHYKWIPINTVLVVILMLIIYFLFSEKSDQTMLHVLIFIMVGYSVSIQIFLVQAILRIENKIKTIE